ncbi:RNA polymerase II-associated protein 3 [Apis mellifera caucasica]|nr:RNA polymerase II-associated protein 3 [Apis mellifera caucasica]KAG9434212.1 RNA polymerase II-associated protein 3 [Apis mellifera carnica]
MDKSILMQKQVKNNAEDLQKEFLDMKNWEEQMKRKDDELRKERNCQITLPPIRTKCKNKIKKISKKINEIDSKSKKIKSYDYSAWDKFDVDKACKEIDEEEYNEDESEDESISKEQLEKAHQEAMKYKNEGNICVQQKKWSKAIGCYSNAIKIFPHDAIFYANRALCQLKLDNFYSAESDCSAAIQLDETYIKAYHRRAIARMNLKQYKEAKLDLDKILKLEPFNKEAKLLFNQIENKIKYLKTSTEVQEYTKELSKNTFEKKIAEKMWNKTTLNLQTANIKNTEINYIEDDKNIKDIINNKNKIKDKKDDNVHDIDIKNERDPRIPSWLPEKDNVIIIEPIEKPPHLHSKKSLIKIPIQEMEFVISHNYINDKTICIDNDQQKKEFDKDNNLMKNNNSVKTIKSLEDISAVPPIPKTAVQFIMNWKTNKSSEFRYKYLKQLPKDSLPKIFQDSMESDIFCQIIEILKIEFIKRKDLIFHYLKDLSQVKRFRTFIMFLSDSDKKSLKMLFEYCKIIENMPQDEISILEDKYEVKK